MTTYTLTTVLAALRKQIDAAGSRSAWARDHGLSASYVADVAGGRQDPGPAILSELGYEQCEPPAILYRKVKK